MTKVVKKIMFIDQKKIQMQSDKDGFGIRESFLIAELGEVDYMTFGQIEESLELDRKSIVAIIGKLQKRKIIEKIPATVDKRQQWIVLTDKGHRARVEILEQGKRLLAFTLKDLTVNEEKAVLKYFSKMLQTTVTAPELESIEKSMNNERVL